MPESAFAVPPPREALLRLLRGMIRRDLLRLFIAIIPGLGIPGLGYPRIQSMDWERRGLPSSVRRLDPYLFISTLRNCVSRVQRVDGIGGTGPHCQAVQRILPLR